MNNAEKILNPGLDAIRSLAIALVVGMHLFLNLATTEIGPYWYIANLGVELFFALSGYLIGKLLLDCIDDQNGTLNFRHIKLFMIRRGLRTVPLYILFLVVNLIIFNSQHFSRETDYWQYLFFIQSFNSGPDIFAESWSLCIEEWSYFLIPLLMILFTQINKKSNSGKNSLIISLITIITFSILIRLHEQSVRHHFQMTLFRLDAIAYGMLTRVLYSASQRKWSKLLYSLGFVIGSALIFLKSPESVLRHLYFPLLGLGLGHIVHFAGKSPIPYWIIHITRNTSKISYPLYLVNMPVIYLVKEAQPFNNTLVEIAVASIVIIGISMILHRFIEGPILRWRDRWFPTQKKNAQMSLNVMN